MVDTETRREILQSVARGDLSPEEAADLLARLETAEPHPAPGDPAGPPHAAAAPSTPAATPPQEEPDPADNADDADDADDPADAAEDVRHVHVRSLCRSVIVLADDDVQGAVADGEHTARLEGDTITIEAVLERPQGFTFVRSGPMFRARSRVRAGDRANALVVRMNPHLAMTATVEAGNMDIHGVRGPITARVRAGALLADGIDSPFDVKVAAGSATLTGRMSSGSSRIECDAGRVAVLLTPDSSVRVRARIHLGELHAPKMVGAGDATLDVTANLGAVDIAVQEDE